MGSFTDRYAHTMLRRTLICAAGVLISVACTAGGDVGSGSTAPPDPVVPSGPVGVEDLPGRLVTLDDTGNIIVIEPDGSIPVSVTDDAGESARYSQPSWSPGSDRLAWSETSVANGTGVGLSDPDGAQRTTAAMDAPPFFMYWSPDGQGMGVLHNGSQGAIEFELVDTAAATTRVVANGSPFYFSWSPASDQLVVHIRGVEFAILDLDGAPTDLGDTAVAYPAPHWTPAGIFHLGVQGLQLRVDDGETRVLARTAGPLALVANGQGNRLAVQAVLPEGQVGIGVALEDTPPLPANVVVLIDVESGRLETITAAPSIGFFWSPDGESLLILEPTSTIGEVRVLMWSAGETRQLGVISPHPFFIRDVLQFFDQYSQSLQLWSPDSAAVTLPGAVEGEPGIWVYLVGGEDPVRVSDGSWAAWSEG